MGKHLFIYYFSQNICMYNMSVVYNIFVFVHVIMLVISHVN